ncbi:DUF2637 domain-containing protein [Streptomyces daliensis]|uniref:DUF2637 domain-containing protein n=1 Tax=Streptomyces daliensis TaxID=299421 RepID=A0A8T4IUS2_9ACTN|nr:DUF2637 domain-containing protein [Streptomyces daliensis]
MTAWDYGAIVALATVGFILSYDALRQVAVAVHVRPTLSYVFPLAVDGFIAYGVRAIVLLRNRPFGARLYAWFLFLFATGASLWANALHAITLNHGPEHGRSALHLGDTVVGVLSTLAPLALAGSVHLYILMARTAESAVRGHAATGPELVRHDAPATRNSASTAGARRLPPSPESALAPIPAAGPSADRNGTDVLVDLRKEGSPQEVAPEAPAGADRVSDTVDEATGLTAPASPDGADDGEVTHARASAASLHAQPVRVRADGEEASVPDGIGVSTDREADDAWLEELLPIARAASERAGRISRDTVKDAVRAHRAIGNDRLGVLLTRLKEEEDGARTKPACSPGARW